MVEYCAIVIVDTDSFYMRMYVRKKISATTCRDKRDKRSLYEATTTLTVRSVWRGEERRGQGETGRQIGSNVRIEIRRIS